MRIGPGLRRGDGFACIKRVHPIALSANLCPRDRGMPSFISSLSVFSARTDTARHRDYLYNFLMRAEVAEKSGGERFDQAQFRLVA